MWVTQWKAAGDPIYAPMPCQCLSPTLDGPLWGKRMFCLHAEGSVSVSCDQGSCVMGSFPLGIGLSP